MQEIKETWVRFLGQEDPLEKGMATHSIILAWRIPWTRGTWWATVHGVTKSWTRVKQLSMYARRHPDFSSCVILGGVSNYSFFLPL